MYDAGPVFDELLDRLHDMGAPAPLWGRSASGGVRLHGMTPRGGYDYIAPTLDAAARGVIDIELSCSDQEREAAKEADAGGPDTITTGTGA